MPVPLAPYPSPPVPYTPPVPAPQPLPTTAAAANGLQGQLVCSGCRNLLLYPAGAISVLCCLQGYDSCAASWYRNGPTDLWRVPHLANVHQRRHKCVQCSCCHTANLALEANQVAHVNCGNCRMLLMYQYGARSVKCAVCNFVTSIGASTSAP